MNITDSNGLILMLDIYTVTCSSRRVIYYKKIIHKSSVILNRKTFTSKFIKAGRIEQQLSNTEVCQSGVCHRVIGRDICVIVYQILAESYPDDLIIICCRSQFCCS